MTEQFSLTFYIVFRNHNNQKMCQYCQYVKFQYCYVTSAIKKIIYTVLLTKLQNVFLITSRTTDTHNAIHKEIIQNLLCTAF